ncbi:DUF3010 family protein [Rhizobium leguminosarum]|uniref:DUF3010 family protein n=1 Tax=Rhizobium leguminosarum TaxID=384 RepID=UPI0013C2515D|nr:DUF3010 family protein [Rhizobium leguminosarum]NEH55533.1 DUF3010 family protein [Rhizobium leguminosarum]
MICGIDIRANAAVLVIVTEHDGLPQISSKPVKKLALSQEHSAPQMRQFMAAAESFFKENGVEQVVIKERTGGGLTAASGITYKIEALIQLSHANVSFVHGNTLRAFGKTNVGAIPQGVLKYQTDAYLAAAWKLVK